MTLTPARQRNAVSEGMALGLLMCGRDALLFNKLRIDLAFEGAWRSWTYRAKYSQVDTDLAKGLDAVWAMTRADASKQTRVLYWEQDGGQFRIHSRRSDWSQEDPDDIKFATELIDGEVPLAGWEEMAREFLARFER
jgi:hypothetical protein